MNTRPVHVNAVCLGDQFPRLGIVVYASKPADGAEYRTFILDDGTSRTEVDWATSRKVDIATRPRRPKPRRAERPRLHVVR